MGEARPRRASLGSAPGSARPAVRPRERRFSRGPASVSAGGWRCPSARRFPAPAQGNQLRPSPRRRPRRQPLFRRRRRAGAVRGFWPYLRFCRLVGVWGGGGIKKKNPVGVKVPSCRSRPFCFRPGCFRPCDPMDCSPPGSSVLGMRQARTLEWVASPSPGESSRPRDRPPCLLVLPALVRRVLYL